MASTNSSISGFRRSNAEAVLESLEKRSSLLVHPHGIEVLKEYKKIKEEGLPSEDEKTLASKLQDGLKDKISEKETVISKEVQKVLVTHRKDGTTAGESEEAVVGESQGVTLTGRPDVVLRVPVVKKDDTLAQENAGAKKQERGDENSNNKVSMILEIAVDKNGGEKKHLQAYDYCRFITNKGDTFLFFVMRVVRSHKEWELAITQESFIYCHTEQKYGFLWREYYFAKTTEDKESTLEQACQGIVRSIHCSTFLQKLDPPTPDCWKTFHNNVAVMEFKGDDGVVTKEWVYKVFDNRFLPTQRKPENWLGGKPWSERLQVEEYLVYEESQGVRKFLGKPLEESTIKAKQAGYGNPSRQKKHKANTDKILEQMPYGTGSIIVIRYKYQNGTHIASKLSHLRDIAHSIQEMHEKGMVHGDIRGHNLLHPHGKVGSITQSCLIDFDLTGKDGVDKYPVGLNPFVPENSLNPRRVKEGGVMKKEDDWIAFGSSIGVYRFCRDQDPFIAWDNIVSYYQKGQADMKNPTKAIDDFLEKYSDLTVQLQVSYEEAYQEKVRKGPGEAKHRGRLSASDSAPSNI